MINKKEWLELKENEKYGMIAELFKRIESLEKEFDEHTAIQEYCPHKRE